jgi:hypothetical protein
LAFQREDEAMRDLPRVRGAVEGEKREKRRRKNWMSGDDGDGDEGELRRRPVRAYVRDGRTAETCPRTSG